MEESTLNPLLADKPAADYLRVVVQFSCGCDAYADVPTAIFADVGREMLEQTGQVDAAAVQRYVVGTYAAQLLKELSLVNHNPDFCPATFGSVVSTEEQS